MRPVATPIPYESPALLMRRLPHDMRLVWLDSALDEPCGRYSYLALDPMHVMTPGDDALLPTLKTVLSEYQCEQLPDIPPFQGGIAGYWSYDVSREWMPLRTQAPTMPAMPSYQMGVFDCVISFDHQKARAWIVIVPLQDPTKRLAECLTWLSQPPSESSVLPMMQSRHVNFSSEAYVDMVEAGRQYILEGDIFEVNLSLCYEQCFDRSPDTRHLYQQLRSKNPAPFGALVQLGEGAILSSSPERLFSLHARRLQARPIKGTIRRGVTEVEDRTLMAQLRQSDKDMAENTMIVDLLRNDLSRVCEPHSIKVPQFCGLETYETVHHLVSVVEGQLRQGLSAVDAFEAIFPGGSITGAPKCRSMEIIDSLETVARGPYCGSAGYFAFNGDCDLSILIRTLVQHDDVVSYQAGGAITLQSDPQSEYEEAVLKASRLESVVSNQ